MIEFIAQNWVVIVGSGTLTSFFGWMVFGRKNNDAEYTMKVRGIYDNLSDDLKEDRDFFKAESQATKEEHKKDVLYFREQLDSVRKDTSILQKQFNEMSMSYTKEVEVSKDWEKKHRELDISYKKLEASHNELKKDHEKLKKAFESPKKE